MKNYRFYGTTAEQMNFKAKNGLVDKNDLEEWATTQNKFVVSIQWYVGETDYYLTNSFKLVVPFLYSKDIV